MSPNTPEQNSVCRIIGAAGSLETIKRDLAPVLDLAGQNTKGFEAAAKEMDVSDEYATALATFAGIAKLKPASKDST